MAPILSGVVLLYAAALKEQPARKERKKRDRNSASVLELKVQQQRFFFLKCIENTAHCSPNQIMTKKKNLLLFVFTLQIVKKREYKAHCVEKKQNQVMPI